MADDFSKYEAMRDAGATVQDVYACAKRDQIDQIAMFRLLRGLYDLSLPEAKEVMIVADDKASSLDEYQEQFVPIIEDLFREDDED